MYRKPVQCSRKLEKLIMSQLKSVKGIFKPTIIKSVSLKIEPLQYIAIYYDGSIFNETDVSKNFEDFSKMSIVRTSFEHSLNTI